MHTLEDLNKILTRAMGGKNPFYRDLYGSSAPVQVASWDEWRALPALTKDALIAIPFAERSFIPLSKIDHVRTSSGTSGKGPLFCPRTHVRGMDYRLAYHDFKKAFLAFTVPLMPHWHEHFMKEHGAFPRVICFDPKNVEASVRLAKCADVDAFSVFVYHVPALGECMKQEGINENIRFAEITGEICSRAMYEYLRATFPNATIVQSYNSSETEDAHIGMPCKPMDGTEPLAVYHAKPTNYLELIDPDTGKAVEPVAGSEGDLLVTAYPGEPSAFPMVRFRIGDTVRVVESQCAHGSWSFTVLGRTDMDFLKLPGGMLRADEIARVLREFSPEVSDNFELHVAESRGEETPMLRLTLHIETTRDDLAALAQLIAAKLRVAPTLTYADGVVRGRYMPLTCEKLEGRSSRKSKRIIRD